MHYLGKTLFKVVADGATVATLYWLRAWPWWPWSFFTVMDMSAGVVARGRGRGTLCAWLLVTASVPRCDVQSIFHYVPRWVCPPHRRLRHSRLVTDPRCSPTNRQPPLALYPPLPDAQTSHRALAVAVPREATATAGRCLGHTLAALSLAQRWMDRGLAPGSRLAGRCSVAPSATRDLPAE